MFSVCSSSKNCPSARCASAANVLCRDIDAFGTKTMPLKHILQVVLLIINCYNIPSPIINLCYIFIFSSYCIMALKVAPIKSLLSKWYMLLRFCLCLCVRVCFVCPFACDYINIGFWTVRY
jgi:hypothetical protein